VLFLHCTLLSGLIPVLVHEGSSDNDMLVCLVDGTGNNEADNSEESEDEDRVKDSFSATDLSFDFLPELNYINFQTMDPLYYGGFNGEIASPPEFSFS
jgi:hypothetical protein